MPEWPEIASFHNLVDIVTPDAGHLENAPDAVSKTDDATLLSMALSWKIDPSALSDQLRAEMEDMVIDPGDEAWILKPGERARILQQAGTLTALQESASPAAGDEPMQQVIKRILEGPPYVLQDIPEQLLPYWVQAAAWFQGVIPELASPEEIKSVLERLRLRSRLRAVAGPDFKGRKGELKELHKWSRTERAGAKVVSGIGGIGKSALVARFVLDLGEDNVIFWLDFDRADLAADDANSILRSLNSQAQLQLTAFPAIAIEKTDWKPQAVAFAQTLAAALPSKPNPVLILDGFEVAQQSGNYQEIWDVLDTILEKVPALHIVVSGRAPVPHLILNNLKASKPIHLKGMDRDSAQAWLLAHGLTDPKVIDRLLVASKRIPFILKLAAHLAATDKDSKHFLSKLQDSLVEGYLYERILNRLSPKLRDIAKDVLVFRTLTEQMLPAILGDSVVPQGLFEQLRKETALVQDHSEMAGMQDGQAGSLRIRPEVRTATLQLLTAHDSRRVAHNHRLATKWYEQNAGDHPAGKAELIYHYLCSGQLGKAREIWQDAYAAYLKDAAQDIPAQHLDAREWLEKILKAQESPGHDLPGWEADALTRIQQSLGRHHFRAVAGILQERPDRTEESHLTVYDAWIAWLNDSERPDKALALLKLDGKLPIAGPAVTARYILAATILAKRGQNQFADSILDLLEQSSDIRYKQKWNATELLIRSARVRLHVSLVNELAIYKELVRPKTPAPDTVVQHILPMDVMTSPFIMKASFQPNRMNISILPIPDNQNELEIFRQNIFEISQRRYGRSLKTKDTQGHLSEIDMFSNWMTLMMPPAHHGNLSEKEIFSTLYSMLGKSIEDKYAVGSDNRLFVTVYDELIKAFASLENGAELAERITVLIATGVKKWDLVTHDLFLANVVNDVSSLGANPLIVRAIVFTLAAFRGQDLRFTGSQRYMSDDNNAIDTYIEQVARSTKGSDLYPAAEAVDLAKAVMLQSPKMPDSARRTISALTNNPDRRYLLRIFQDYAHGHKMNDDVNSVILYLLGPDPLDLLYRSALSLPLAADISIA